MAAPAVVLRLGIEEEGSVSDTTISGLPKWEAARARQSRYASDWLHEEPLRVLVHQDAGAAAPCVQGVGMQDLHRAGDLGEPQGGLLRLPGALYLTNGTGKYK